MQCELLTTYLLCILNKFISMCTRSYTIKSDPRKHNVALTLFFPERKTLIEVIRIIKYSAFYKFSPAIELLLRHFFLTCPNDICIEKLCLEKVMGLDGFFYTYTILLFIYLPFMLIFEATKCLLLHFLQINTLQRIDLSLFGKKILWFYNFECWLSRKKFHSS